MRAEVAVLLVAIGDGVEGALCLTLQPCGFIGCGTGGSKQQQEGEEG